MKTVKKSSWTDDDRCETASDLWLEFEGMSIGAVMAAVRFCELRIDPAAGRAALVTHTRHFIRTRLKGTRRVPESGTPTLATAR